MMTELTLPEFEFRMENGALALHDGFVVTFFLPASHEQVGAAVRACIDRYLRLPGMTATLGVIDDEGLPSMLDAGALDRTIAERCDPSQARADLHVIDSPDGASSFSIRYYGLDLAQLGALNWPNASSAVRFTFPTMYLGEEALLQLVAFASDAAALLPYSFGYIAPAFVYLEGVGEPGAFQMIRSLSRRFQCLDIPALLPDCFEIGGGPKGAYWGNYLSASLVERLGGEARIREAVGDHDVHIFPVGEGSLAVYLGAMPVGGDVNRREDVSTYKRAAVLFSTAMLPREVPYLHFDAESMREWLYRFGEPDEPSDDEHD